MKISTRAAFTAALALISTAGEKLQKSNQTLSASGKKTFLICSEQFRSDKIPASPNRVSKQLFANLLLLPSIMMLSSCSCGLLVDNLEQARIPKSKSAVWFVRASQGGISMVSVERPVSGRNKMEAAVQALLEGPSNKEAARGLASEIPRGTILLGLNEKNGGIELNLSRRFAIGGAADSMETRLRQLSQTVAGAADGRPVYLNVEGHRLSVTQGEGIEVKQPINK